MSMWGYKPSENDGGISTPELIDAHVLERERSAGGGRAKTGIWTSTLVGKTKTCILNELLTKMLKDVPLCLQSASSAALSRRLIQ